MLWFDAINLPTLLVELRVWERTALSRLVGKCCRIMGHSKSSSYSYSSRSRLQCGLGISKKCLFVRPSSLEICCPIGLKGFSYLNRHTEDDISQKCVNRKKWKVNNINIKTLGNLLICFLYELQIIQSTQFVQLIWIYYQKLVCLA